jgi:hypothetical protein
MVTLERFTGGDTSFAASHNVKGNPFKNRSVEVTWPIGDVRRALSC